MAAGASPSSSVKKTVQTRSQPLAGQKCGGGESKFTGRLEELFEVHLPALGKGAFGFVKRIRTKPRGPERAVKAVLIKNDHNRARARGRNPQRHRPLSIPSLQQRSLMMRRMRRRTAGRLR